MKIRRIPIAALIVLLSLGLVSYLWYQKHHSLAGEGPVDEAGNVPLDPPIERDLEAIKQRGTLTILAPYNSTTHFLLRGEPMGYEYELLQAFAREHGLKLVMEVVKNQKTLYQMLNRGEGDIVAARIIPKQEDEAKVSFTHTLYRTEPALVQQKAPLDKANLPEPVKTAIASEPADIKPDEMEINARLITKPSHLAGETVTLPRRSAYQRTLIELADEISGDIHVVEVGGKIDDEALINKVAKGDIEYTIVQNNLAELKEAYFTNIKIRPLVGVSNRIAWVVRKNSSELLKELNRWIDHKKNGSLFDKMYKKYFIDREGLQGARCKRVPHA
ncbi:MAG: transporter substrate-binding domain-containing protein [Acidobacteriota bacterium]